MVNIGLAVVLGTGAVACGEGGKVEEEKFVGAAKVCDGLFGEALAGKVELVTSDTEFFGTGTKGLENVVTALKRGYESGRSWATGAALCELAPKGGGVGDGAALKFSMYAPQDIKDPATDPGSESYAMGKRAEARRTGASLYLDCASPRLKGSSVDPLRIYASFSRGRSDAPDTKETHDANLEILHAGALVVVKELECEKNAGLPESVVLVPRE